MSSLAAQLAQSTSLNAALLVNRSRRKPGESYLFTGRDADQHDLESIHALGANGLLQLASLNPSLRACEDPLFSDHSKVTDRTLLSPEASAQLDKYIAGCLSLLGPYLMEPPTGKVIEWLVRRFRINEFNIEAILSLFLPYHDSPHFAKMVTILHIKQNSTWSFLLPYKSAAQSVPRIALVTEMLQNSDFARFVASLLPSAIKTGHSHRVLLAFNAATLHDFIVQKKSLDEGTLAYLLPALLEPLEQDPPQKDAILGAYVLLATLSQKCQITPPALKAIVGSMAGCARNVSARQFTNAAISVCEPQPELERISDRTLKAIIRLPDVGTELRGACSWMGVEKLICPLLHGLIKRLSDNNASSLLDTLIATASVPTVVIQRSAQMLLNLAITSEISTAAAVVARRLLSNIQQRHSSVLHKAADEVRRQDEKLKDAVDNLIISLSMVHGLQKTPSSSRQNDVDMILASTNAESNVRVVAVKSLISTLAKEEAINPSELDSIHSALLARVQDTNQQVVEALYSQPSVVTPILIKNAETYIDHLETTLSSLSFKPNRSLLRIHLTSLIAHFCPAAGDSFNGVFHRILFPLLLYSKPRHRTADLVWDIIHQNLLNSKTSEAGLFEWLLGCAAAVNAEREGNVDSVEKMIRINAAVASTIANNIFVSNHFSLHFDALLAKLQDENPHVKLLGCLITSALLGRLSGEHQIDAAHKTLGIMGVQQFTSIQDMPLGEDSSIDDNALGQHIVVKPSSRTTLHLLQISIVAMMARFQRPAGPAVLNWLVDPSSMCDQPGQRASRYVELMRMIYRIINLSGLLPVLMMNLLRALFTNLEEDALAFLAGVWTVPSQATDEDEELRIVALHHAAAFIEAHVAADDGIDFQTILPSLLVAIHSHNSDERQSALECATQLRKIAERKFTTVYKFDAIYGASERSLQYLDRGDFKRYLDALTEHYDHLVHDMEYLKKFHQQHLGPSRGDKKQESDYKHHVLCYILSHINLLALPTAQVALLKSIEAISHSAKVQVLLPMIRSVVTGTSSNRSIEEQDTHHRDLTSLVISCFDASVARDLNNLHDMWGVFVLMLRKSITSGTVTMRSATAQSLEQGLFASLNPERKITVCDLLLEVGAQNAELYPYCKQLLANLVQEVSLIVQLLDLLQPPSTGTPRASKRAKLVDVPEDSVSRLSLFVEVLGTKSLPGSLEIVSHLLETLNRVVQSISPTHADVNYIEQLLMAAVENAAERILEIPNLSPNVIRSDILVELIRVSDNPQTFHHALLLMASLARLAPDSVLHNVMPVFTFMGSNVFHRDDTYSFRVVQQTIDSIVPVMVASLKRAHSHPIELYIASRDFLRVFTDAVNHIPRHRRTNFFAHLIDVLGCNDFLAPVCMLLVEKAANRVVRQSLDGVQSALYLPSTILHHYPPALQVHALTEILRESQRLAMRIVHPETAAPTFLDVSVDDDHSTAPSTLLRRRAQALVTFIGHASQPWTSMSNASKPTGEAMSDLVAALISLATLQGGTSNETKVDGISDDARVSINKALGVMSAVDFANAVLSMIESDNEVVQTGAFNLLHDRLADVEAGVRQDITPTIIKIVEVIRKLLKSQVEGPLLLSVYGALKSIGLTLRPGEETCLIETVPLLISAVKARKMVSPAFSALSPLPLKLGPRIIPYLRDIVTQSVAMIREGSQSVLNDAFSILHGLLASIPTFWSAGELTQVVMLYVNHCSETSGSPSPAMSRLMKAIAKRAPVKVLLPAMIEMWSTLKISPQTHHVFAYFDLLARALRKTMRSTVMEQLRPLFNIFLEAFNITKVGMEKAREAETRTVSAFKELVVKLNEAAFRPLFRRLYDWAFVNEEADIASRITFCHIYATLLDFFNGLMNPYMSFLLQPFADFLKGFGTTDLDQQNFWSCVVEIITKSLSLDDGVFWRNDKLRQITAPLIEQVSICVKFNLSSEKRLLQECLRTLVDSATDDTLLKSINLDLLMHTRSDDVRLRLFALTCSETLWRAHGGKLLGFVAETITFIAECSEDDNDMVVKESFKLKDAVESVAGKINGL